MNNPVEALHHLLRSAIESRLDDVHISMPGRIESYDISKQRAAVQPLIRRGFRDPETGERIAELLPIVNDVPVEFFGGGDYALTFPVVKGMTCRLACCSTSLDRWLVRGGEIDPGDDRRFTLSDSVAVVGLRDFAHALTNLPSNAWVMAAPAGGEIRLGIVSAAQSAIRGNAYRSAEDLLFSFFVAAFNALAVDPLLSGTTQTACAAAGTAAIGPFNAIAASFLSSKVKIE